MNPFIIRQLVKNSRLHLQSDKPLDQYCWKLWESEGQIQKSEFL